MRQTHGPPHSCLTTKKTAIHHSAAMGKALTVMPKKLRSGQLQV